MGIIGFKKGILASGFRGKSGTIGTGARVGPWGCRAIVNPYDARLKRGRFAILSGVARQ